MVDARGVLAMEMDRLGDVDALGARQLTEIAMAIARLNGFDRGA